jgi:hypothetical protein
VNRTVDTFALQAAQGEVRFIESECARTHLRNVAMIRGTVTGAPDAQSLTGYSRFSPILLTVYTKNHF